MLSLLPGLPLGFCGLLMPVVVVAAAAAVLVLVDDGLWALGNWVDGLLVEGGRQNSSKRSARRGECMWM